MVKLRILEILKEQGHTKYWLYKQMDLSCQDFNRMVIPACDKVYQIPWRTRAYTGNKFGKS